MTVLLMHTYTVILVRVRFPPVSVWKSHALGTGASQKDDPQSDFLRGRWDVFRPQSFPVFVWAASCQTYARDPFPHEGDNRTLLRVTLDM